jgi:FkbM family methyltransferase
VLIQQLKHLVIGTRLEPAARRAYRFVRPLKVDPDNDDMPFVRLVARLLPLETNTVDVGANRGQVLAEVVAAFPRGRHFAFEAIPELCEELRDKFPTVHVEQMAVTEAAGKLTFNHVTTNSGFSGLRRRSDLRQEDRVTEIEVQAGRLDDFVPEDVRIGFLKIDVEGGELGVFKGAMRILKVDKPIILFEHGSGGAPLYGTSPDDVYRLLHDELGYSITTIPGAIARAPGLAADEFRAAFERGRFFMFVARQ